MSEFLREDGVSAKAKLPRRRKTKQSPQAEKKVPEAPKGRMRSAKARPRGRFDSALDLLMRDFKAGVSRLRGLTERLSKGGKPHQPEFKSDRPSKPTPIKPGTFKRRMPPSITKIMEREIRMVSEKVPQVVHVRDRDEVIREYRTRSQTVIQQQLPQIYAAILRAEREVREKQTAAKPATVALRPKQPGVQALMRAAKAIRSGRLPFLDRATKQEAQQLLGRIWGTKRTKQVIQSSRGETRRLIEQHRLIPTAVRENIAQGVRARAHKAGWRQEPSSSMLGPPDRFVREVEREIIKLLPSPHRFAGKGQMDAPIPVAAHDIPRLQQQGVPAFKTAGVAAGGSYVVDPGENVHVITRDSNPLDQADDAQSSPPSVAAPRRRSSAQQMSSPARSVAAGAPGTPAAAPQAARHAPPPVQQTRASRTSGGLGAATGGGTAGGEGGVMELRGTLDILGLKGWMAEIEARTKGHG